MVDLIAFGGFKGSGKDEAAVPLLADGWVLVKFADPMRLMLHALDLEVTYRGCHVKLNGVIADIGFDRAKREIPYVRHVMERLGTEAGRGVLGETVWVDYARRRISDLLYSGARVVCSDTRFQNEVDLIHELGGIVVRIDRPGVLGSSHASEAGISNPDFVIENNDSLATLHNRVVRVLESGHA